MAHAVTNESVQAHLPRKEPKKLFFSNRTVKLDPSVEKIESEIAKAQAALEENRLNEDQELNDLLARALAICAQRASTDS